MSSFQQENLYFVLVRTQFASNLGSTVRVMKNMGIPNLILVRPECEVGMEARSFAMKGAPILDTAQFLPSLTEVSRQLGLLVGTTGRFKGARSKFIDCRGLAEDVLPRFSGSSVGVVFGSEGNGLWKDELRLCQFLVEIPTDDSDYQVLNLAQSAAIVAYQLNLSLSRSTGRKAIHPADGEDLDSLMARTEDFLKAMQLPTRISTRRLVQRLRKIAGRAELEREDINMLHGLIKEIERKIRS